MNNERKILKTVEFDPKKYNNDYNINWKHWMGVPQNDYKITIIGQGEAL